MWVCPELRSFGEKILFILKKIGYNHNMSLDTGQNKMHYFR